MKGRSAGGPRAEESGGVELGGWAARRLRGGTEKQSIKTKNSTLKKNIDLEKKEIFIENARENNLSNLSIKIPLNRIVVITGVSGSGKSTLAFDILYAEGRRRYLESLNAYARQFIQPASRPDFVNDMITS